VEKAKSLLRLTRPINSLMVGLAVLVGTLATGGLKAIGKPGELLLAALTGFSLSAAAMAVNDYCDREIDAVNEPQRPIPSGKVTPQEALALTAITSTIGLGASAAINPQALGVALIAWILLISYSTWGKKRGLLGNLMVSGGVALPFVYGGVLSGRMTASLSFALVAFLVNTGREITKGIVDVEGDAKHGVNTLAVNLGPHQAAKAAAALYLTGVASSILPWSIGAVSYLYLPFTLLTDLGLILLSMRLVQDPSRDTSRTVKNQVLILMALGLLGFALGSLS